MKNAIAIFLVASVLFASTITTALIPALVPTANKTASGTEFVIANAAGTSGNCAQWSSGLLVDSGTPCPLTSTAARCIIDNDTQSSTALTAAQYSGTCQVGAASTIVEIDVFGSTLVITGSNQNYNLSGDGTIQVGKFTPSSASSTNALMSASLATSSGKACALPSAGSATCPIGNFTQAGASLSITTTALAKGDLIYVSSATASTATHFTTIVWYTTP